MTNTKLSYETPKLTEMGDFETLTRGGTVGTVFDGNFTRGDPVPLDPNGNPLIFS
jgi:hypothetical protein